MIVQSLEATNCVTPNMVPLMTSVLIPDQPRSQGPFSTFSKKRKDPGSEVNIRPIMKARSPLKDVSLATCIFGAKISPDAKHF